METVLLPVDRQHSLDNFGSLQSSYITIDWLWVIEPTVAGTDAAPEINELYRANTL